MSLDEVQRFLLEVAEGELEAERAKLLEPDVTKFMKLVWKLDARYAGEITSGISRPEEEPAVYTSEDNVAAAATLHARSLFAVARYEHVDGAIYRGWMGDSEDGRRGEGMRAGCYVRHVDGALKIITRLVVCSGCKGAGIGTKEEACPSCEGAGWTFDGGEEIEDPGSMVELRKLKPPSDERYHRGYERIQLP
jgi:hypothetical protein